MNESAWTSYSHDMEANPPATRTHYRLVALVFLLVAAAQLYFVSKVGNDIPHWDQWGIEGSQLYPAWLDGSLTFGDLLRPHNEHRIAFTRALDLALFTWNGTWDPLVQLLVSVLLRATAAAFVVALLISGIPCAHQGILAAAAVVAFSPLPAWENVLWGFQSQVLFVILLCAAGFCLIANDRSSTPQVIAGYLLLVLAQFAMGPALLAALAVPIWLTVRSFGSTRPRPPEWICAVFLAVIALALRTAEPAHEALQSSTPLHALLAFARIATWPHIGTPVAVVVTLAPVLFLAASLSFRRLTMAPGESPAILLGIWALLLVAALAWSRGAGDAFAAVMPSRYVDFLALLNLGALAAFLAVVRARPAFGRLRVAWACALWGLFILAGLAGVGVESWRWVIAPRWAAPRAAIERAVAFQRTGDTAVFAAVPPMFRPHADLQQMYDVLHDPRLDGRLPPSFQMNRPLGPLSRATRAILSQAGAISIALVLLAICAALLTPNRRRSGNTTTSSLP